jgi:hypothetical protein
VPRAAREQRRVDFLFQRPDLPADGRLRQEELVACLAKAEPPRDRSEARSAPTDNGLWRIGLFMRIGNQ